MAESAKRFFLLFFAFLCCESVYAQAFQVIPTDKSMEYLGIIFGGHIGAVNLGGAANPMLSKMFERFNFIVVSIGVVILSYIGIAAAINTAREGEAMGKKFSLWVPLRSMLGMLLMVPGPGTGYSVVQMTVIWVVLNGIGAANSVWNVVLDQMAKGQRAVGTVDISLNSATLEPIVNNVIRSSICMQTLNSLAGLDLTHNYGPVKINTIIQDPTTPADPYSPIYQKALVNVGVEGSNPNLQKICGSYTVTTEVPYGRAANLSYRLSIKTNALLAMFSAVEPLAQQIISSSAPSDGYGALAIAGYKAQISALSGLPSGEDIRQAARGAAGAMAAVLGPFANRINPEELARNLAQEQDRNMRNYIENVNRLRKFGWIQAGGYYYFLTQSFAKIDDDAKTIPSVGEVPEGSGSATFNDSTGNVLGWNGALYGELTTHNNRNRLNALLLAGQNYWTNDYQTMGTNSSLPVFNVANRGSGNRFIDRIASSITKPVRESLVKQFQKGITGKDDPLIAMGIFGYDIMFTGEGAILAMIALTVLISIPLSSFAACNGAAYALNVGFVELYAFIASFIAAFWICGATLGIYVPLVPYIIFTATAIGWMILVVEAIVGAPIIALAMVQPSGEELGQIKAALLILANIFLRPTLMIFGFIIAGSVVRAAITLVNFGFTNALDVSVPKTTLFGIIPVLGIYAFLVMGIVNQGFGLIYELPNKVLRYIGASPESGGAEQLMKKAEEGFGKGGEIGAKGVQQTGSMAEKKVLGSLKSKKDAHDAKKKESI